MSKKLVSTRLSIYCYGLTYYQQITTYEFGKEIMARVIKSIQILQLFFYATRLVCRSVAVYQTDGRT